MTKHKLRVGLVYGGQSSEHEVSLRTAKEIQKHLDKSKYKVVPIKISRAGKWPARLNLSSLPRQIDLAFLALHGTFGEDGTIQGMLEMLNIPYTCSKILASALAMDKARTQDLVERFGIPTPRSVFITEQQWAREKGQIRLNISRLPDKVVIKPNASGSSVGVHIINKSQVARLLAKVLRENPEVLVQQYIPGREITAPVLGNDEAVALPLIEIVPRLKQSFYSYEAKYAAGGSDHLIPAPIAPALTKRIKTLALQVHRLLGCRGVTRSDFILTPRNQIYFLEINTIPGMTQTSLLPQSAANAGIAFAELLDTIISLALEA
jgi:D-alanine-D-alanine ligase